MTSISLNNRKYQVDAHDFLIDPEEWDENFAESMAPRVCIPDGLSGRHWEVIRYIRITFEKTGRCPLLFETCRANNLDLEEHHSLFPLGYLRAACKLAGLTYREGYVTRSGTMAVGTRAPCGEKEKTYRVDVRGFLVDASEWDEDFAVHQAYHQKIPGGLTGKHWDIISYIRNSYAKNDEVPTEAETCRANKIELDDLEQLYPEGYHRGAVKMAGLRAR